MLGLENKTDKFLAVVLIAGIVWVGMTFVSGKSSFESGKSEQKKVVVKKNESKEITTSEMENEIEGGKVWLVFEQKMLRKGQKFNVKIYGATAGEKLGVFNMNFKFNPEEIVVDFNEGDRGLVKGQDIEKYISSINTDDVEKGLYRIAGITVSKHAQGEDIHLMTINFKAVKDFKIDSSFDWLQVNEWANDLGKSFGIEKINRIIEIK